MPDRPRAMARNVQIVAPAGPVKALRYGDVIRATGIPYARAGRWQAPRACGVGPLDATRLSPACPQLPMPRLDALLPTAFDGIRFDEDCQRLSVTAPAGAHGLPVMVWLHGGSYESCAGDMRILDPGVLVREEQVVVVAISHRLGLFGWLGGGGRPANLGALDVIMALRWVAANIAAFGGDPGCVTLFGQSSGGDLAARLMLAVGTRGLIHRAIVQSAPLHLPLGAGRMRQRMRRVAEGLHAEMDVPEILARQAQLRRAVRRFGLAGQMPFGPEFGAAPFPAEEDLPAAHAAIAPHVPLLVGHAREEAALFLPPPAQRTAAGALREPLRRLAVQLLTERLYARPAQLLARRHAEAGGYAARYVLDWPGGAWGRAHLSDLPLLFPGPDWIGTPLVDRDMDEAALSRAGAPLRRIWADFARQGRIDTIPAQSAGAIRLHLPARAPVIR